MPGIIVIKFWRALENNCLHILQFFLCEMVLISYFLMLCFNIYLFRTSKALLTLNTQECFPGMGKFSNYVIILRQIGPLHYYIEKGSANIKVRPINYTTHFNYVILMFISYHVKRKLNLVKAWKENLLHTFIAQRLLYTNTKWSFYFQAFDPQYKGLIICIDTAECINTF